MKNQNIKYFLICVCLLRRAAGSNNNKKRNEKAERIKVANIPDGEYDPAVWGRVYPYEYEAWLETKEARPEGLSKYKRGWDTDKITYDRLSEFPFLALLFNGWGFGVEYNEPRGHYYMLSDQVEIDRSRVGSGGVCLTCKTPYMQKFVDENGPKFFKMPYMDARNMIPEKHRNLGVACIDCHDNRTMSLEVNRWTIKTALKKIRKKDLSRHEMRLVVCAQCHVSYSIPKGKNKESLDVVFPWGGSRWGNISIENIIADIRSHPSYREWKQKVTGFKLAFIRHPEFEFFTRQSVHFKAGLSCADCHMPFKRVGANKISNHNVMSPLKDNLRACVKCHPQTTKRLKEQVIEIQDRTVSLFNRAGYALATSAKLFEMVHKFQKKGKNIDTTIYKKAKDFYLESFYRVVFIGAENSVGFHNPTEAGRILGDAISFAGKVESLLRQSLTAEGVAVPVHISLELSKYLNGRGKKKLMFQAKQEIRDPFNVQDKILPRKFLGLK